MRKTRWAVILVATMAAAGTVAAEEPVDWTGWYMGGFAGYISGELSSNDPAHATTTGNYDDDGYTGGLYGGYRGQGSNRWVFGGEVMLPLFFSKGTADDILFYPGIVTYEAQPEYGLFLGGQVGRAYGKWLPYLYGLFGWSSVEGKTIGVDENYQPAPGYEQTTTATHFVWQLGFGADVQLNKYWFIGARIGTYNADKADHTMSWNLPGPNEFGYDGWQLQFNFGYRF